MRRAATLSGGAAKARGVGARANSPDAGPYSEAPFPVIALFCFYVVVWFLQVGWRIPPLGKIRIELLIAVVLIVILFIYQPVQPKQHAVSPRGVKIAVSWLLVLLAIQVPLSANLELSWVVFVDRVLKFGFMAVFIAMFVRSPRDLRLFLAAFLVACGFICQESFRGALSGAMVWQNQGVPRLHGDTPMFQHPNSLAGLATGVLPFVVYLFPLNIKLWVRAVLLAVALTALGCVMYSGSRTAYVGVVAFILFFVLTSKHKVKVSLILITLLPIVWVSLPDIYRERFETIFTGREIEGDSMGARKQIMRDGIAVFSAHPLGVGVAAFPTVRKQMFGRQQDTHNLYLEVATNTGIQGLIAFLAFVGIMLRTLWKIKTRSEQELARLQDPGKDPTVKPVGRKPDRKKAPPSLPADVQALVADLLLVRAAAMAVSGYIYIRLVLGFFGMDLYEIYWWIGLGMTIALCTILTSALNHGSRLLSARGEKPELALKHPGNNANTSSH